MKELQNIIERAWDDRDLLKNIDTQASIREVVDLLDTGKLRVAEPTEGGWQVKEWVKKDVVMYFPIQQMETTEVGIFEIDDKNTIKKKYEEKVVKVNQQNIEHT